MLYFGSKGSLSCQTHGASENNVYVLPHDPSPIETECRPLSSFCCGNYSRQVFTIERKKKQVQYMKAFSEILGLHGVGPSIFPRAGSS